MEGRVLADRYRLISKLGQGGMGSVWRAEHLELGRPVAIKLMDPGIAMQPDMLHRFKREAQTAARLQSPHVVQISDYGVDRDTPFIVMELLYGESLEDRLARRGSIGPCETARILTHVARALSKAHELGLVHRDLKPGNIFLLRNDDEEIAKVLDFGIVKVEEGFGSTVTSRTSTGALLGTPFYMSPEQARGRKQLDYRTDIWAMAVIAFECLTGQKPFTGESVGDLLISICTEDPPVPSQSHAVPPGFDAWFSRGAAREPESRFRTAKEQAEAFRALAEGNPETRSMDLGSAKPSCVGPVATQRLDIEPAAPPALGITANQLAPSSRTLRARQLQSVSESVDESSRARAVAIAMAVGLVVVGAGTIVALLWIFPRGVAPGLSSASPEGSAVLEAFTPTAPPEPRSSHAPPAAPPEPAPVVDAQPTASARARNDRSPVSTRRAGTRRTAPKPSPSGGEPQPPPNLRSRLDSELGL